MKGKYKITYQVGGDTPNQYEDTSFFDLLSKYAQGTPQDEPEETDNPQEETKEQYDGYDQSDFQSLQDKYDELSSRFDELSNTVGSPSGYKGDDEFLNFMFDDSNNNAPLDISMPQPQNNNVFSGIERVEGARTGQPTNLNSSAIGRGQMVKGTRELMYRKLGIPKEQFSQAEERFKKDPDFEGTVMNAYRDDIGKRIPEHIQGQQREYMIAKGWYTGDPFYDDNKVPHPEAGNKLTAGQYAAKAAGRFQNGGEPNKYQQFYDGYINSPAYKDRLLLQGYREQDINNIKSERLNNVKTSKLVQIEGDPHNIDYNSSAIVPHEVRYNPVEGPQDEIASHEYAHKAGASETKYSGNPAISMNANEIYLFNTLNKSTKSGHMTNPYEAKADLDSLRFMMEDGYIKSPSQKYEIEDLQKADKKDNIKKSTIYRRLNGRYKQEDLLKLLNDVAGNNPYEMQTAQNGGNFAPVYTNNPNDPRLKAYNDSLSLYNKNSYIPAEVKKYGLSYKGLDATQNINDYKNHKYNNVPTGIRHWSRPTPNDINDVGSVDVWMGEYKKPLQPVVYQKKDWEEYDGRGGDWKDKDGNIWTSKYPMADNYKRRPDIKSNFIPNPEPQLQRMPYSPVSPIDVHPQDNPQSIVPVNSMPPQQDNYRVEYVDPETNQNTHRDFPNEKQGSQFQRLMQGNRTGYYLQNGGAIYTDNKNDPRIKAYNDSLNLYNSSENYRKTFEKEFDFLKYAPVVLNEDKAIKQAQQWNQSFQFGKGTIDKSGNSVSGSYEKYSFPSNLKKVKWDNKPIGWKPELHYGEAYDPRATDAYGMTPVYKKPVQPVVYQKEPQLKRMPYSPIDTTNPQAQGSPQGIAPLNNIPQQENNYRVDYQENGQNAHRNFPNAADGSRFQELISGNRTGYWEKFQNGGGHLGLPEINMSNPVDNNNVSNRRDRVVQPHLYTEEEKRLLREQEIERNRGTIKGITKEEYNKSKSAPLGEILRSPMTAIKRKLHNQELPANFSKAERNPYDSALDIVNPLTYLDAATHTAKNIASPIETTKTLAKGSVNLASNLIDGRNIYEDGSNEKSLGILGDAAMAMGIKGGVKDAFGIADRQFSKVGQQLESIRMRGEALGLDEHNIANLQMQTVGITSAQRAAYNPIISNFAEKYITPYGYEGFSRDSKLKQTWDNIKKGGVDLSANDSGPFSRTNISNERADAWKLYLGKPQTKNTFSLANTAPVNHPSYTGAQLRNMDVYNIDTMEGQLGIEPGYMSPSFLNPHGLEREMNLLRNRINVGKQNEIMGGYNKLLSKDGMQYNDIWDLNPKIKLNSMLPSKLRDKFDGSSLFYNKSGAPRGFEVPVDKFLGKPFMSHGTLPYTSNDLVNNLRSSLTGQVEELSQGTADMTPRINKYKQYLDELKGYPKFQDGGDVSQQGYNFDSPYNNAPYLYIDSPTGEITMEKTRIPLLGVDEFGNKKIMKPGKKYKFAGTKIKETPIK